jgi:putative transposase
MTAITTLAQTTGRRAACARLAMPRSTYYHHLLPRPTALEVSDARVRSAPPRALDAHERQAILELLNGPRFIDSSPAQTVAELLDEGRYLASERTCYRVLAANAEVRERRNQARHPHYSAPELLATAPNQVWSWDITKLKTMTRGVWFHLYHIIDIYSRYTVGWMVAEREAEALAVELIEQTCARQGVLPGTLTIHADRGSSMRSHGVAELLSKLDIIKSHSRPYCSNDNPYSESQFKTLKYHPRFPERFGTIIETRAVCGDLLNWCNNVHRHSGIAMLTPAMVHFGCAEEVLHNRDKVLREAFEQHPGRFLRGIPAAKRLPGAVYINKPIVPAMNLVISSVI